MGDEPTPRQKTAIGVKLFGRTVIFTGWAAAAVSIVVMGLLILLVVRFGTAGPLWISAGLWIAMMIYWSVAAKKSAPVASAESAQSRSRHQLLLNLALLLAFIRFPWTGYRWLPVSPLTVPIGLAIQVGSIILDVWAMRCLGRNWSGAVAIKVDHELIRAGPYRFVRHPIYTAMIGMYLGTAVVSGELHGLLAVILCVIAYWRKTRMEERGLREAFGRAYDDYARESWALIPWLI